MKRRCAYLQGRRDSQTLKYQTNADSLPEHKSARRVRTCERRNESRGGRRERSSGTIRKAKLAAKCFALEEYRSVVRTARRREMGEIEGVIGGKNEPRAADKSNAKMLREYQPRKREAPCNRRGKHCGGATLGRKGGERCTSPSEA